MAWVRYSIAALAAAIFVATGCATPGDVADEQEGAAADGQDPPTSEAFLPERWIEMDVQNVDGSTYHLRLELGEPVAAIERPSLDTFDPPTACDIDEERDLLIPARILATSTTPRFTHEMSGLTVVYGVSVPDALLDDDAPPHEVALHRNSIRGANTYGNEANCAGEGEGRQRDGRLSGVLFSGASEGEQRMHSFWIVIHEYYTPTHPDGQPEILRGLGAHPLHRNAWLAEGREVSNVSGTGIVSEGTLPFTDDSLFYEDP